MLLRSCKAQCSKLRNTFYYRAYSSLVEHVSSKTVQCYVSTSHDPFLNLSIEHYFLEKSPADSAILFFYTNRPCIVFGRNQNPWLEVNLNLQRQISSASGQSRHALSNIDLVRRRSGGGTVFHDKGNMNWTVISPMSTFTRDKHAEMVVRALRTCGVERARVNERHDIVLDQGKERTTSDPHDLHRTAYTAKEDARGASLKISGSAYKLVRGRALHHGTCLLSSPNLGAIPAYLRSPGKPYIRAKGVDSVSSPITNVGIAAEDFQDTVFGEFRSLYGMAPGSVLDSISEDIARGVPEIQKGVQEITVCIFYSPRSCLSNFV